MIQPSPQKNIKQANNYYSKVKKKLPSFENDLEFMNRQLNKSFKLILCGDCTTNCSRISREFQRAFETLSKLQKSQLYYDYAHITYNCLFNVPESVSSFPQKSQRMKVLVLSSTSWKWLCRQIEIDIEERKLTLIQEQISLNLRNYILRHSRNKERQAVVLESTSSIEYIQTLRISNYEGSFDSFQKKIKDIMEFCLRSRISKRLGISIMINDDKSIEDRISIDHRMRQERRNEPIKQNLQNQSQVQIHQTAAFVEVSEPIRQTFSPLEVAVSFEDRRLFIEQSWHMQEYSAIRQNVYFDYHNDVMRKIFLFETGLDEQLYLGWICDNFNNHKHFQDWKKYLINVELLSSQQNSKIYREMYQINKEWRVQLTFQRTRYIINNIIYFFDTALPEKGQNPSIKFNIIKIEKSSNYIKVIQDCKIEYQNNTDKQKLVLLHDIFLGDISLIIKGIMLPLDQSSEVVMSKIFEQGELSKIQQAQNSMSPDQFYTIDSFQDKIMEDSVVSNQCRQISREYLIKQKQEHNATFLKIRHPMNPFPKSNARIRQPIGFGKHPFWEGQWKINGIGQMVNINEQKIKAQNGVLKQLLKSMGKNLFNGKSILNVSLPVTIFGTQSFLSNLCNAYAYAPKFLEKAVNQADPINKLKNVVIFNISSFIAELQMEKPFNPILGQTYQAMIDGCPVYGQQISHHPPISAVYMNGRGYKLYGQFQCKINMGLNTATGLNDGIMNIVFDDGSSSIKYNSFSGELSGLIYGDRKFALVNSNHFIDIKNRLYLHLKFGKHKGVTQYSRFINGIQGKIVKIKQGVNLQKFWQITKDDIAEQYGFIKGCWTDDIFYEEEYLFNSWNDFPYIYAPYPYSLQSDSLKRLDLKQRVKLNYEKAQEFKEQMEQIQRNDRKLRQKYKK